MDGTVNALLIVLIVVATCGAAAVIWASFRVGQAASSAEKLADDMHERLGPLADSAENLLGKADVTVDAANAELLRLDAMVTRAEEAVARFDAASNTLGDVVRSPGAFIGGVAERLRRRHAGESRDRHAAVSTETADRADPKAAPDRGGESSEIGVGATDAEEQ